MHKWFKASIKMERTQDNGMTKKVTEDYLVDAMSYTEAEARIIEEMRPFISGEFTVDKITKCNISEIFVNENGDRFYTVVADFITMDEKSGSEKRKPSRFIVQANDLDEAKTDFDLGMKGTLADYSITNIKEEKRLFDFFVYDGTTKG